MKIIVFFGIIVFSCLLVSCEDPELNSFMDRYCNCVSKANESDDETLALLDCVEMMDSIQKAYKDTPEKLGKIVKKTNECD